MTTTTIPYGDGSLLVWRGPTASAEPTAANAGTVRVFDLRQDELPQTGRSDEFEIEDYIVEQDVATRQRIAQAGNWVADTMYPGIPTLASLRLRAGLSQAEFAAKCGLKQPHVSRYETGKHEPGVFQAQAMANALGVALEILVNALKAQVGGVANEIN